MARRTPRCTDRFTLNFRNQTQPVIFWNYSVKKNDIRLGLALSEQPATRYAAGNKEGSCNKGSKLEATVVLHVRLRYCLLEKPRRDGLVIPHLS